MSFSLCKILLLSAGIGVLSGCAQDFPKISMDDNTKTLNEMLNTTIAEDDDYDSKVQLASIYFSHNYIDQANELLSSLVSENPNHAEAAAWFGANNCKLAARSTPWLMGLRKLYRVNKCLHQVEEALAKAPDDFTVRLISINTGLEVAMFDAYEKGKTELMSLRSEINTSPNKYPPGALSHYYMAEAKLAGLENDLENKNTYLKKIIALDADSTLVEAAQVEMAL